MNLKKIFASAVFSVFALAFVAGVVLAGHNGAVVEYETIACGETTFSAKIADPNGTHKVANMHLVVSANDDTQSAGPIPTNGDSVSITVGPFFENTVISWNVFGGAERDYDQPSWNGYGTPGFGAAVGAYAAEQGGFGWVLDGPENPNPFTNFNEVTVEGCSAEEYCKEGAWQEHGFRNQGQCIRYVNTGQDSR